MCHLVSLNRNTVHLKREGSWDAWLRAVRCTDTARDRARTGTAVQDLLVVLGRDLVADRHLEAVLLEHGNELILVGVGDLGVCVHA